jgi:hypothetical protein
MEFDRIRLMEHLAVDCPLSLQEFCGAMQRRFGLPEFEFDSENETEWGSVEHEGVEYNVSRPYERGTLEEWDGSVPVGCNFGVTLMVLQDCPPAQDAEWSSAELVPHIGQGLADLLGRRVYHHRTWVGAGENVVQKRVFHPRARRAERVAAPDRPRE